MLLNINVSQSLGTQCLVQLNNKQAPTNWLHTSTSRNKIEVLLNKRKGIKWWKSTNYTYLTNSFKKYSEHYAVQGGKCRRMSKNIDIDFL